MLALLLCVVVATTQASASLAPTTAVAGLVVNSRTSAPVADARVLIVELNRPATTGADGRFVVRDLPPGQYTLTVSTIGYSFVRRTIQIADTPLDLVVPLAEGASTYHESLTVQAPAMPELPGRAELNPIALQDLRSIAVDDPVRTVQSLPGVATGDDFRADFSVRGAAFRQVGIVVDGTATPLLFHAVRGTEDTGSMAMINSDVLSGASLHTGAHPQRHGDWLGATLEFTVREGSRDRTTARGSVSATTASVVVEGPLGSGDRGSWLVSSRTSYLDWMVRKIEPQIRSTVGFTDAQSKVVYDLGTRQQLQWLFVGGDATYHKPSATSANEVDLARSRSGLTSLSWRYARPAVVLSQRVSVAMNTFRNTGPQGQEDGVGGTTSLIWRGDVTAPIAGGWLMDGGLRAERQHMHQTLRDFSLQGGTVRQRNDDQFRDARTIGSAWAGVERHGMAASLSAGVRLSHDTSTDDTIASPWLEAERALHGFTFFGSAGRSHQFPALDQAALAVGPLQTERAWSTDAGVRREISHSIGLSVTGFHRREDDVLRRVNEDRLVNGKRVAGSVFVNVASELAGRTTGIDIVVQRRGESGLTGWVGYTWSHTRDRDVVTGERFDGDFDQHHTLNVVAQQRLSNRMKATAKLRVGSNVPLVGYFDGTVDDLRLAPVRNAVRLPTYARLDLSGSRTFTFNRRRLTLFLEVLNATGHRNLRQTDGSIRNGLPLGYTERVLPIVPSAGLLLEF